MALTETPTATSSESSSESSSELAITTELNDADRRSGPSIAEQLAGTGDHRTIGRLFIGLSLLFMTIDLVIAALVNFDITSKGDLLGDGVSARLMMNHPLALLLCGAMPLMLGLAIYVVPRQVGSPAIALPRAAAASLWTWLLGSIVYSVAVAANGSYGGSNLKLARLGPVAVGLICVALLVGVACVMVTVLSLRPVGMSLANVPHFSFAMLVTGALWMLTLPVAIADIVLFHIQQPSATDIAGKAFPALEWLVHQPSIYIVAIPLFGIIADVVPGIMGSRIKPYGLVQALIGLAGLLAFGAWAQSSIQSETLVWVAFAIGAGLPLLGVLAITMATIAGGRPKPLAALGGAVLAPLVLLLAALTGLLTAIDTLGKGDLVGFARGGFAAAGGGAAAGPGMDVGQFYFVIAAVVIVAISGCWYWGTGLVEGGVTEPLGKVALAAAFPGAVLFGGAHLLLGLIRPSAGDARIFAAISGAGAVLLAIGALTALGVLLMGLVAPQDTTSTNAVGALSGGTLEWATAAELEQLSGTAVTSPYPLLDQKEAE